jgi:hypothetical protein
MKAKITRPDGTIIELEGLTDDVVRAVQALPPSWGFAPVSIPSPWWVEPWPYAPRITFTTTTPNTAPAAE